MMEKKRCLTFIIFLIDSIYAARISLMTKNDDKSINKNYVPILVLRCSPNEIINTNHSVCEPICDLSSSSPLCVEKTTFSCTCSKGYVRNNQNRCVRLTECSQEESSHTVLKLDTFNSTQNTNLEENQNTTLFDDNKMVQDFVVNLKQKLNYFLHSQESRIQTNSGRNVRHTDNNNKNHQNSYRNYEKLLHASSDQTTGLDSTL